MCGGNKKVIDYFLKNMLKIHLPGVLDICLAEKLTLIT